MNKRLAAAAAPPPGLRRQRIGLIGMKLHKAARQRVVHQSLEQARVRALAKLDQMTPILWVCCVAQLVEGAFGILAVAQGLIRQALPTGVGQQRLFRHRHLVHDRCTVFGKLFQTFLGPHAANPRGVFHEFYPATHG